MAYDTSKVIRSNESLVNNYIKREQEGGPLQGWQRSKLNLALLGGNAYDTNQGVGSFNNSFYGQLSPEDQKFFGYSSAPVGTADNKGTTSGMKKSGSTYSIESLLGLGAEGESPYKYGYSKESQENRLGDPRYDILKGILGRQL